MKVAILHCRKSTEVCTGALCLQAYNHKLKHFQQYEDKDTELCAFMDCGGCGIQREFHRGMIEKMDRLKSIQVEKVHLGVCIRKNCPSYDDIITMLDRYGMAYHLGTH